MKFKAVSRILTLSLLLYVYIEAFEIDKVDYDLDVLEKHNTKQFYANDNGTSKLIIRRGADFKFTIQMDEYVSPDVEVHLQFVFDTRIDRSLVRLPSNKENGWTFSYTTSGNDIDAIVYIPGDAPVGVWYMYITVIEDDEVINYHVPQQIVVLFNAWSPADPAYFPDTNKLNEYVLNEIGHVYFYDWKSWYYSQWVFGQFQSDVLNAILFILDRTRLRAAERGDIVKVTRTLTHMLNDGGRGHHGVLRGRWKEPYNGTLYGYPTTNPSEWTGSPDIFRLYYSRHGTPVGYGQCWVFAGILTTAYRSLGIASRPLGNFASAHDDGNDLTADTYLDKDGNINLAKSDTLWNFHEWVEAWFRRDDLKMTDGEWQELDATPQGLNDGKLQVGPASISHIYNSTLGSKYETLYLYSEVNSDEVVWNHKNEVVQINRHKVGLAVKTKSVGSDYTDDITRRYKPREGTPEERASYKKAAEAINKQPVSLRPEHTSRTLSDVVSVAITRSNETYVGDAIVVQIKLKNRKSKSQQLRLSVKASSVYYNGKLKAEIKSRASNLKLKGLESKKIEFSIDSKEYMSKLADQRTIIIDASAIVGNITHHVVERFTLNSAKLEIKTPSIVKRNSSFNVTVTFRNPLKQTLKNCSLIVEGKGFRRKIFKISDVAASSISKTAFNLRTSSFVSETFVVKLYTKALKESVGFAHIKVSGKPVHRFLRYRRKSKKPRTGVAYSSNRFSHNITRDMFECCDTVIF